MMLHRSIVALFLWGLWACAAAPVSAQNPDADLWWRQMFSVSFDGHGGFVTPHLDALHTTAASLVAVGFHGPWDADLSRDMPWMRPRFQAFEKHPGVRRIVYIEGNSASGELYRASPDGRVLFTAEAMHLLNDPARRGDIASEIQPGGGTAWFGDWQFMSGQHLKSRLGAPLPSAAELGLAPFVHPLDGSAITDEAEFWRTRSARPLIGKGTEKIDDYLKLSDEDARALGLADISVQRDGKWLTNSGEFMLYDMPFAHYQAAKASRVMEDFAPDMIHYDDWDLRAPTAMNARADIHVAAFREFVKRHFTPEECRACGFEKDHIADFDVLHYLLNPPWRGEYPGAGDGPLWRCASDARWLSDKVWRAFQIACLEDRLASMKEIYRLNKESARRLLGHDVPMVANIIPTLGALFLQRDCVDMANFEWPVFKTYGAFPKPFGYYPEARLGLGPRMASKIGVTGHAIVNPYVEPQYSGWSGAGFDRRNHETLHKVIYFDLLANRGIPAFGLAWDGAYSPGSIQSAGALHAFMNEVAPIISRRDYLADIGLVASSWSQIAAQPPFGGWKQEVSKRYFAEFLGWSQYLFAARDFPQWDVVPFDDVKLADLVPFKLLILPSILVVTADQLAVLEAYLKQGGRLLDTGETGTFNGPEKLLMPRPESLVLDLQRRYPGQVIVTERKPGLEYHLTRGNAPELHAFLQKSGPATPVLTAIGAPDDLGIYASVSRATPGEFTVDLVNYHYDLASDQLTPVTAAGFQVQIQGPRLASATAFQVEAIRYDETAPHNFIRQPLASTAVSYDAGKLTVQVPPFTHYEILRISPRETPP